MEIHTVSYHGSWHTHCKLQPYMKCKGNKWDENGTSDETRESREGLPQGPHVALWGGVTET